MNLLLFDVDGVLVEDRGYRAAVIATVNYFSRHMGVNDTHLTPASIDLFHAHGFVNEWDSTPFILGVLLIEAVKAAHTANLRSVVLEDFLPQIKAIGVPSLQPHFDRYVAQADQVTGRPSQRALQVLLNNLNSIDLSCPTREAVQSALHQLFDNPYDFFNAHVTQVFQEYIIGSKSYAEVYQLPPRFALPSLLLSEDRPLLMPEYKQRLDAWQNSGVAKTCVYTARPSQAPIEHPNGHAKSIGFSPEAELAIDLVGMHDYPLIASGQMMWLAQQVQQPIESMTKPAPIQALAAIGAAISHDQIAALRAAHALLWNGELIKPLDELKNQSTTVWVVEDAMLGLQSARGAIDLLRQHSIDIQLHAIGIANGGPKAAVLQSMCEVVLPDVNVAIDYIAGKIDQ
jgi:phosphoglycolate phosphatase-like HAD superfamily hydrolase